MSQADREFLENFRLIMQQCKRERKAKTKVTNKALAKKMNITENYLSAFESARAVPSLPIFFRYLLLNGFDLNPLVSVEIKNGSHLRELNSMRNALIQKIYSLDEGKVKFLYEQLKLAEALNIKTNRKSSGFPSDSG